MKKKVFSTVQCRLCNEKEGNYLGSRVGTLDGREFNFYECSKCKFKFVENYRTDYHNLYNENYYCGLGADPIIDYDDEITNTNTLRVYEWNGICNIFNYFKGDSIDFKWLDFGCGSGGLLKYALNLNYAIKGFDENFRSSDVNLCKSLINISNLDHYSGYFDFITFD
jgi:hypothetical protein